MGLRKLFQLTEGDIAGSGEGIPPDDNPGLMGFNPAWFNMGGELKPFSWQ